MKEKFIFTSHSGDKVYVIGLLERNAYFTAYYAIMNNKNVILEISEVPTSWTYSITEA